MQIRIIIRVLGIAMIIFLLFLLLHIYLKLMNIDKKRTPKPANEHKSSLILKNLKSNNLSFI
jgi:regulatory protein YycI of two-component signal transduction system YycFG